MLHTSLTRNMPFLSRSLSVLIWRDGHNCHFQFHLIELFHSLQAAGVSVSVIVAIIGRLSIEPENTLQLSSVACHRVSRGYMNHFNFHRLPALEWSGKMKSPKHQTRTSRTPRQGTAVALVRNIAKQVCIIKNAPKKRRSKIKNQPTQWSSSLASPGPRRG